VTPNPVNPGPQNPVNPVNPGPVNPVNPANPANPVNPVDPNDPCPTNEPCDGVVIPGAPRPGLQTQETVKSLQSRLKVLLSGGKSSRSTNPALSSIRQANIERVCEQLRLRHFHPPECNDLLPHVHR